jgi:3-hydroxymyristoyl/3-hydroxydecanoyl-(acyl carrier protein) dehydratase
MSSETILFSIPAEHPCYADHFPGAPVVPGALLLKWVFEQITQKKSVRISVVKQIKFLAVVLPNDQVRIEFSSSDADNQMNIDCYREQTLVAMGKVVYEHVY